MSEVKSITTRSGILFVGKIIDAVFMFTFNLLAAKYVGAKGYGTYVYINTLLMFISIAIKMGMDHGLTAMIPGFKEEEKKYQLVSFSISLLFALSAVILIVFGFGSGFVADVLMNNPDLEKPLRYFLPLIFPIAFVQMSEGIFRSIGGIKHYFISKNILMPAVLVISFVTMEYFRGPSTLMTLIMVNYVAWAVNVFYLIVVLVKRKVFRPLRFSENKEMYKKLIVISLPLILVGLLEFLMGRTDAYVTGFLLSEAEVGVYSIVDKIAYIGNFMFITAGSMMAPSLANHYKRNDMVGLKSTYQQINKWILIVNSAVFFGILLLGAPVLEIFGKEFILGVNALYLLALAQLVNAVFGPLSYTLAMVGLQRQEWNIGLFTLALNLVLDIFVAKKFGITGIALVTVGVYFVGNMVRAFIFYRKHGLKLFTPKSLMTVGFGLVAFLLTQSITKIIIFSSGIVNILFTGIIFMIMYLILVFVFDMKQSERKAIGEAINSFIKRK